MTLDDQSRSGAIGTTVSEETIHPMLTEAFQALESAGVRWSLLRPPRSLKSPSGDIDILVAERDEGRARAVLRACGFISLPFVGDGTSLASYHSASQTWIWLDITSHLEPPSTRLRELAHGLLERRQRRGSAWWLSPSDAFWCLLVHRLSTGRGLESHHRQSLLDWLPIARPDDPLASALTEHGEVNAERFIEAVRSEDWTAVQRLGARLSRRRHPQRIERVARGIKRAMYTVRGRHAGVRIALLGPDGSGKSTLAAGIADSFLLPTRRIYMGFYPKRSIFNPEARFRVALPGRFRGLGLHLIRLGMQWRRWSVAVYHRRRGRVVIFDRYADDWRLRDRPRHGRLRRLGYRLGSLVACPLPELVLVLDAPGEEMLRRKGEHDVQTLEAQRERYRALAERFPQVRILDASVPAEDVRRRTVELIWQKLEELATDRDSVA